MKLRVWAYAKCETCRRALKYLTERGVQHEVIPIREQPPGVPELRRMFGFVGGDLRRLFNTSGQDYRAMKLGERLPKMTVDDALALLSGNGNLVKRPFALSADDGVVGFKNEEWERFLERSAPSRS